MGSPTHGLCWGGAQHLWRPAATTQCAPAGALGALVWVWLPRWGVHVLGQHGDSPGWQGWWCWCERGWAGPAEGELCAASPPAGGLLRAGDRGHGSCGSGDTVSPLLTHTNLWWFGPRVLCKSTGPVEEGFGRNNVHQSVPDLRLGLGMEAALPPTAA